MTTAWTQEIDAVVIDDFTNAIDGLQMDAVKGHDPTVDRETLHQMGLAVKAAKAIITGGGLGTNVMVGASLSGQQGSVTVTVRSSPLMRTGDPPGEKPTAKIADGKAAAAKASAIEGTAPAGPDGEPAATRSPAGGTTTPPRK